VSFNISVMAEAGDFKFRTEFGFAKTSYKITPKDKNVGVALVWELPKFRGSPLTYMQWLKVAILN